MTNVCYGIVPMPDILNEEKSHLYWEDAFTDDEINTIIKYGDSLTKNEAKIEGNVRNSTISWIEYNEEAEYLYHKMGTLVRDINARHFDFDIYGFVDPFQYTIYGADNNHYEWHYDKGLAGGVPRKLSLVLQLSDPSEYEGGDLEIHADRGIVKTIKRKGLLTIFPSFILHRVTPVTNGIRKTLVVWASGNKFR
jgi:PKHD-type hydroxylase